MADLPVPAHATRATQDFERSMFKLDVTLPLSLCQEHVGSVIDFHGREVFVVDHNGELSDTIATARAELIVLAVNTCGGFKAERADG